MNVSLDVHSIPEAGASERLFDAFINWFFGLSLLAYAICEWRLLHDILSAAASSPEGLLDQVQNLNGTSNALLAAFIFMTLARFVTSAAKVLISRHPAMRIWLTLLLLASLAKLSHLAAIEVKHWLLEIMAANRTNPELMYGDLALTVADLQHRGQVALSGSEQPLNVQAPLRVAPERLMLFLVMAELANGEALSRDLVQHLLERLQHPCPADPQRSERLVQERPCDCLVKPHRGISFGANSLPFVPTASTLMACTASKVLDPIYTQYLVWHDQGKQVRKLCATQPLDVWHEQRGRAMDQMTPAQRLDAELFYTVEVQDRDLAVITHLLRDQCKQARHKYDEEGKLRVGVRLPLDLRLATFEATPVVQQSIRQAVHSLLIEAAIPQTVIDPACRLTAGLLRDADRFVRCVYAPMLRRTEKELRDRLAISVDQYEAPLKRARAQETFKAQAALLIGALCSSFGLAFTVLRGVCAALVFGGLNWVGDEELRPMFKAALSWALVLFVSTSAFQGALDSSPPMHEGAQRSEIHKALVVASQRPPEDLGRKAWRVLAWWAYGTYTSVAQIEALPDRVLSSWARFCQRMFAAALIVREALVKTAR